MCGCGCVCMWVGVRACVGVGVCAYMHVFTSYTERTSLAFWINGSCVPLSKQSLIINL